MFQCLDKSVGDNLLIVRKRPTDIIKPEPNQKLKTKGFSMSSIAYTEIPVTLRAGMLRRVSSRSKNCAKREQAYHMSPRLRILLQNKLLLRTPNKTLQATGKRQNHRQTI
jgi:hypothetical protein